MSLVFAIIPIILRFSYVVSEKRVATVSIVIEDELQNLQRQKILPR